MPNVEKGVETPNVLIDVVPGAIVLRPTIQVREVKPPGGGEVPPSVPELTPGRNTIRLLCRPDEAREVNVYGNPITTHYLYEINPIFNNDAQRFPGLYGDDNHVIWALPVPSDMAAVPNMVARLHIVGG